MNEVALRNRYDDPLLQEYYAEILACQPDYPTLRQTVADVIKSVFQPGMKVLDIGAGGGESAKPVLDTIPEASIDLLDISPEMQKGGKHLLTGHEGHYTFILGDALDYLKQSSPYDIIFSEFTIHNFDHESKRRLFTAIFQKLTKGGLFVLLDKIVLDDIEKRKKMHEAQMSTYRLNLKPEVADAIVAHEDEDFLDEFRMDETETIKMLQSVGFNSVEIVTRVERDAVIKAGK